MKALVKRCMKHLEDVNESYVEHLTFTLKISSLILATAVILLIHGMFPWVFTRTGSRMIARINRILRERTAAPDVQI